MSVERSLRQSVQEIADYAQARVAQLDAEARDLREKLAAKESELDAARQAPKRLASYPPMIGNDYACPRCWIDAGKAQPLRPVPSNKADDVFRCRQCVSDFTIEYFR